MPRFSMEQVELPIVQAPMAGGPSTPALAAAVAEAGGLGFLASGYAPLEALADGIDELRGLTERPFGVNLFVPSTPTEERSALEGYAAELAPDAERYGAPVGEPRYTDDGFDGKVALLLDRGVPLLSFTFGCPDAEAVDRVHAGGAAVWVTVTMPEEAVVARDAGADALVVQGVEAGGHRGTFDDAAPGLVGLLALLQLVRAKVDLPLVAAGAITTGAAVAAVLAAGARAAQIGTVLMLTPEAGTSPAHRGAFASDAGTGLTRAFTGRTARGIVNRFMRDHPDAPSAYPEVGSMVAPMRAAARERGDPDAQNLFAGQTYPLAVEAPAGEVVRRLVDEARDALGVAIRLV